MSGCLQKALAALSFALASVFCWETLSMKDGKEGVARFEGDGRGGYGVCGFDGNVRWNSCRGEIEHGTQGYLGES